MLKNKRERNNDEDARKDTVACGGAAWSDQIDARGAGNCAGSSTAEVRNWFQACAPARREICVHAGVP